MGCHDCFLWPCKSLRKMCSKITSSRFCKQSSAQGNSILPGVRSVYFPMAGRHRLKNIRATLFKPMRTPRGPPGRYSVISVLPFEPRLKQKMTINSHVQGSHIKEFFNRSVTLSPLYYSASHPQINIQTSTSSINFLLQSGRWVS